MPGMGGTRLGLAQECWLLLFYTSGSWEGPAFDSSQAALLTRDMERTIMEVTARRVGAGLLSEVTHVV